MTELTTCGVRHVVVAVPAHNEQELLPRCLAALTRARQRFRRVYPEVGVEIVVALDRCVDGSALVATSFGVTVVPVAHGCVGASRDSAVSTGLARAVSAGRRAQEVWVANTDADTVVPLDWLVTQVRFAEAGLDLLLGTVEPGPGADPELLRRWHRNHVLAEGHTSVHGANLGIRASAWTAAGGFGALGLHEDVTLADRLRAMGAPWRATDLGRVTTSSRLVGKVQAGFAGYLRDLMVPGSSTVELAP